MAAMFSLIWHDDGEPVEHVESSHATTIRRAAVRLAANNRRAIRVMRGTTCAYVIEPDGTRRPPPGAEFEQRENCRREQGACFCTACRADRRAGRPAPQPASLDPEPAPEDDSWQRFLDGTL